ncbi:uncharacterized protein ANIA_11517 [Aspergillus nidulans FGSC A4]|uniref:Uncharacterized protein n=1 Tax=Emericella nidulans (strain FGSC A4 / ATCC 38163 / CBS 112.46 / NRRL 194 / M139) TaxID=227321 RepID=C8V049_EMENI|nr:hypothetical protein [Aspergillus nidulans FGSC A4]CBF69381.1 TPA: hypothetical protein ANIA_11517 [Aspergillus nidulans FGSC A4]
MLIFLPSSYIAYEYCDTYALVNMNLLFKKLGRGYEEVMLADDSQAGILGQFRALLSA